MLDQKRLRIVKGLILAIVIVGALWGTYVLSSIFNPLLIALLLTYISDPIITRLEKVFKHRLVAVIAIYLYLIVLFILIPTLVMGRLYTESKSLYVTLLGERCTDLNSNGKWDPGERFTDVNRDRICQPDELFIDLNDDRIYQKYEEAHIYRLIDKVGTYVESIDPENLIYIQKAIDVDELVVYLKENVKNFATMGGRATRWVFSTIANSIESVFDFVSLFVFVPLYTFFFLYEWNDIKGSVKKFLPAFYKDRIIDIVCKIDKAVSSFFRGRLIICILKSLIIAAGLWICGIRFSLFIGLVAGFLSVIPLFGPIIGAIPAFTFVVIDFDSALTSFVAVVVVFLVAEFLEGVFLQPYILGAETGLHPITLIVSFMVFGQLLGLFGVLLAVPLMAIVKILGIEFLLPVLEEFAEKHPGVDDDDSPEGLHKKHSKKKHSPREGRKR